MGDPGNWNVVRDRRGKVNNAPQLITVVNTFEALDQKENTMAGNITTMTNNIHNNGTRNKGNPSQDEGEREKKMST